LGGELKGEGVEALRKIANVLEEIVVGDKGRDGGKEASGGGDKSFRDAGSDSTEAGSAGGAQTGEGVDDTPDGAEKTDERGDAGGGGEPGHAFFGAADFVSRSELHADRNGLEGFDSGGRRMAGASHLRLQLAVAGGVHVGERRAGGDDTLRVGDTFGGTKNSEELVALTTDTAEEAHFLEDEGPGNQGKEKEDAENGTRDPAGLRKNVEDVADESGEKRRNNFSPSEKANLRRQIQRNTRVERGQKEWWRAIGDE